jgi:hypothetical protein
MYFFSFFFTLKTGKGKYKKIIIQLTNFDQVGKLREVHGLKVAVLLNCKLTKAHYFYVCMLFFCSTASAFYTNILTRYSIPDSSFLGL